MKDQFKFIDLFAGIGGIRLGFESIGAKCVFSSEWNKYSQKTYMANFLDSIPIEGDITKVSSDVIPDHDILLAGFPCQPFSVAGVSKKNSLGRATGFEDKTQGTLFFEVARILKDKKPQCFLLENVKNLVSHDKGKTFQIIMETLQDELGYYVYPKVIDGQAWVPQHRERIIIVGFKEKNDFSFDKIEYPDYKPILSSVLHPEDGSEVVEPPYTIGDMGLVSPKYTLSDHLWDYLQKYAAKHRALGHGFGYGLAERDGIARTLSARYYKDGAEILIPCKDSNPRRLTPRECARIMGFPDTYKIVCSDLQAYKQFGNSVVVPMIAAIAKAMKPYIK